jgi:hypothetical protein
VNRISAWWFLSAFTVIGVLTIIEGINDGFTFLNWVVIAVSGVRSPGRVDPRTRQVISSLIRRIALVASGNVGHDRRIAGPTPPAPVGPRPGAGFPDAAPPRLRTGTSTGSRR